MTVKDIVSSILEDLLEKVDNSPTQELFHEESNMGTKEEFTIEVKSEVEPVSPDAQGEGEPCPLIFKDQIFGWKISPTT